MPTIVSVPRMPPIGRPESYYAHKIHQADQRRDMHLRESLKVGQYVTLALNSDLTWEKKERYFEHAIHRHCAPPIDSSEAILKFYEHLKKLVKEAAGEEATRVASREDDLFAERLAAGEPRDVVRREALAFFQAMLGDGHRQPDFMTYDDWHQIVVLRNVWME